MFGQYFYHESLRKIVVAFGTIFNNINIQRKDSNGNVVQSIKVPLAYSPKEKFIARLDQQADLQADRRVAVTLPRMGFEISGINYDPSRKLNRLGTIKRVRSGSDSIMNKQFNPVPYNISMNLYSFTASAEGGLQIIEQILPFFQPDYTVTMIMDRSFMDTKRDIPFVLENVSYDDSYTGTLTSLRRIIYTLTFTAKIYLYGPISQSAIIKKVSADLYDNVAAGDTGQGGTKPSRVERVTVQPNPTSADKDDDYTYTTTLEFFTDNLDYEEATGEDK